MAARRPVRARHRVLLAVVIATFGLGAAPPVAAPAAASCGGLLTFEETMPRGLSRPDR